eukprot:5045464-Amphidinium_carterae.1
MFETFPDFEISQNWKRDAMLKSVKAIVQISSLQAFYAKYGEDVVNAYLMRRLVWRIQRARGAGASLRLKQRAAPKRVLPDFETKEE